MLVQKYTRTFNTEHRDVEPGIVIREEGIALVWTKVNGRAYVRPSTGAADEIFAGFSLDRNSPPAFLPKIVSEVVVPESGVVDLMRQPLTGQILVKAGGEVLAISANAPVAGKVQLVGTKLYFFLGTPAVGATPAVAGDNGKDLYVQFMYEPTVAEARTVLGDLQIGGLASTEQERIGVTTRAESLATTFYDASADWTAVVHPKLGVGGKLTSSGSGTLLENVIVMQNPAADAASYGPLVVKVTNA